MRGDKLSTRVKDGGMEIAGLTKEYYLPDTMSKAIQGCLNLDTVNRQLFPQDYTAHILLSLGNKYEWWATKTKTKSACV